MARRREQREEPTGWKAVAGEVYGSPSGGRYGDGPKRSSKPARQKSDDRPPKPPRQSHGTHIDGLADQWVDAAIAEFGRHPMVSREQFAASLSAGLGRLRWVRLALADDPQPRDPQYQFEVGARWLNALVAEAVRRFFDRIDKGTLADWPNAHRRFIEALPALLEDARTTLRLEALRQIGSPTVEPPVQAPKGSGDVTLSEILTEQRTRRYARWAMAPERRDLPVAGGSGNRLEKPSASIDSANTTESRFTEKETL